MGVYYCQRNELPTTHTKATTMTTQQLITIQHIEAQHEAQRFLADQAAIVAAALCGELGVDAQLIAMSEAARELRSQGDEAGYQAIKAEAYKIYEGSK
jgi:hypothetical protein